MHSALQATIFGAVSADGADKRGARGGGGGGGGRPTPQPPAFWPIFLQNDKSQTSDVAVRGLNFAGDLNMNLNLNFT